MATLGRTRVWWGRLALIAGLMVLGATATSGCANSKAQEAEEKKIKDAQWHAQMGAGYFESGEIPLAIRELHKAIEMDPNQHEAHYLLGFIYMGRRDYPKAITHFKRTVELKPEHHFARNNLGTVYLAMERWREAAEIFRYLLDQPLYTTPELAHNNLGWALFNMRQYSEALEHFKQAVFLKPQLCLGHNNMGRAYLEMGARSQAEDAFRKAISKCPTNYAEPHFNLGKLLQANGNARAQAHFQRCYELQPDSNLGQRCRQYLRLR